MAMRNDSLLKSVDWLTIGLYLALVISGWLSICGASYDFGSTDFFSFDLRAGKQLVWIGCALVLGIVLLNIKKMYYEMYAFPIYLAFIVLLVVTIFIAPDTKGSRSWLVLGPVSVQPAEFAKFATSLALAKLVSTYNYNLLNKVDLAKAVALVMLPMLLIVGQKETGSALVYLAFFFVLYREGMSGVFLVVGVCAVFYFIVGISLGKVPFESMPVYKGPFWIFFLIPIFTVLLFAKNRKNNRSAYWIIGLNIGITLAVFLFSKYIVPFNITWIQLGLCGVLVVFLLYKFLLERYASYLGAVVFLLGSIAFFYSCEYVFDEVLQPHQQMRIKVVLGMEDDLSGAGYNVNQSKIAIGSGGFFGKGFLNGTQTKLKYVPEQDTDFIFCTVGEEQGFVGSTAVLLLFAAFIIRLLVIAERQGNDKFTRIYGYSLVSIFTFHLFINVGMVLGLTPVIGIPLPFFSYGGSSLWGFTILVAILLRLDAERNLRA